MSNTGGRHPFAVAAWMLVGAVGVATVVGVLGGILSPSLVVDLVAMWPLLALVVILGIVGWLFSRKKQHRAGAIVPLALFTAMVLAVALHLGGWDQLPSAETRLTGPPASELSRPTLLTIQIVGDLEVRASTGGAGYSVDPILRGGAVGVPEATETSVDDAVSIEVAATQAPSWYLFSGWRLSLAGDIPWRLVFNGRIDADLSELEVESGAMAGSGVIRLGPPPPGGGSLVVAGEFRLLVAPGTGVAITGDASVPSGWTVTDSGATSPSDDADADGWDVSVRGDTPLLVGEG